MGYSNVAGELNVYGTTSLSDLTIRANCLQYGNFTNLGTASLNRVTASNLTVTGNFSVTTTNTTVTNSISINNLSTSTALKVVQFESGGPGHTHNVAEFWDYTTCAMVIDPEGNVAIHGEASPGYSLTVGDGSYLHTVYSDFYSGNASGLSNITSSNLSGALSYTQLQNTQTNVTTVGTLTSLNVASTVNGASAYFTTADISVISTTNVLASNLSASNGIYGSIKGQNTVSASSITLTTPLGVNGGGTGQTTSSAAFNALSPMTTAGDLIYGGASGAGTRLAAGTSSQILHGGTTPSWASVSLSTDVTGTLPLTNGGTGQTTAQAALDALAASTTSGYYLRGNGTNVVMAAISAADVPTLNQNTTGTAAGLSQTLAIASGGTGQTTASAAFNALSPITTLGDIIYGSATNTASRLAGSTASTVAVLTQTGTGSISAAPAWTGTTGTGSIVLSAAPTITGTALIASVSSSGAHTCAGLTSTSTVQTNYTQGTNTLGSGQAYFSNPTNTAGQCASCVVAVAGSTVGSSGAAYFGYNVTAVNGYSHGVTGASQSLVFRASPDMSGSTIFTMDRTGGFTAAQDITAYSDARIKTEIKQIEGALDKVSRISGYTYTRTDEVCKGKRQAGVLAQEIQEVLPEVVGTNEETGYYTVSYGNITALLIEALKEERRHREALEERLAKLEKLLAQE